ncbi:MAG: Benzylsuccinate synthase alpha subunit [Tenericutes bacterium ADurb.Bin239]|nr:MAG: Benzylsuccinate synthase alpha subunit [Tenericutes bacterium ADurb.Bin239]
MNERVKVILERLHDRKYRELRVNYEVNLASEYAKKKVPFPLRASDRLQKLAEAEKAIVYPGDRIGFYRTIRNIPKILTDKEFDDLGKKYFLFDGAQVGNISSDYEYTLKVGFDKRLEEVETQIKKANTNAELNELKAMKESILAIYTIADKYRAAYKNNKEMREILTRIPRKGATSFHEALVFLRLLNFTLWLNANKHNTLGRFDQYMYPYFKKDIESGRLTKEEAFVLIQEFFLSLNFDSDLYPGVQQGDNGQSLVLGGVDLKGKEAFNELSKLCLEASLELNLIDPKINMRVSANTADKWFLLGTKLTKKGLGFPQYSNDDVVIPALVKWGYKLEHARDYVVAACWEFIIPKYAMDIPNVDAVNFPELVNKTIKEKLLVSKTYDEFEKYFNQNIHGEVERMVKAYGNYYIIPSPFQSLLMDGCVERRKDISEEALYQNFGFHGAGIATAVDSLAVIKSKIFKEEKISKQGLIDALKSNYEGYEELRHILQNGPKMGNNDDDIDDIAVRMLDVYADACSKYRNARGGIIRPGTGTAMYYIWHSERLGATPDGRKAGEPFGANYSPSINSRFNGVLSVIQSFSKPNLERVCNGGPLTLEFHDTVFRNEEGVSKVAALVQTFVKLRGHQLQLNAVNRETLLDAQKHPEKHKNLIVRVWGWSGYFNELDPVYQNHVIQRLEFLQ